MPSAKPIHTDDLEEVLGQARLAFESFRQARIFITGGTGFFGHWLLESLLHANQALGLEVQATVLTRDATRFQERAPHIARASAITLLEGDVQSFLFPSEPHTHIVHAATDSGSRQNEQPAFALAESILAGTRRVLLFARETRARRLLYTSSGAVYGRSSATERHIPETSLAAPDPLLLQSSYDEAKRMSEHLCVAYAEGTPLEVSIARCFAFVGPHLPLDAHFAIGNFLRSAIRGDRIHIRGDGTPLRSWLYMGDLAAWLWTMLARAPANRAYNVGSEEAYSIREAAHLTESVLRPGLAIQIDGTASSSAPMNSYVPSTVRAQEELSLHATVPLAEALRRTAAWHGYIRS